MPDNIHELIAAYRELALDKVIDHDKFNQYAIVHHSTGIEGSTLTETETRLLLDEGVTPQGKPLEHSLMVKDHYEALQFVLRAAENQSKTDLAFIKAINGYVMRNTGSIQRTVLGDVDVSKGEFRKGNVRAGDSYFISYDKVETYTQKLAQSLSEKMKAVATIEEQLELSYTMHFDLVSIHPFYDGNGRTSRLLMNYVQHYYQLPLSIVFKEDKNQYFEALQQTRKNEDLNIFFEFMNQQYGKFLSMEIEQYKKDMTQNMRVEDLLPQKENNKGKGLSLFF